MYKVSKGNKKEVVLLEGTLIRIRQVYPGLTNSEQIIADYIVKNANDVVLYSVGQLAKKIGVSEATIVRFCHSIGYKGFKEFKMSLAQDLVVPKQFIPGEINCNDTLHDISAKITHSSLKAINDTNSILDYKELEKAVDAICNAKRIDFYGVGYSGLIAQDAHLRFARIGKSAYSYIDPHNQAHSAALLKKGDVAIGISLLGRTTDILYSLSLAKEAGATVISLTKYSKTPITEISDINLFVASEEGNFRTGASRISQMYLVDILFAAVALRDYDYSLRCLAKGNRIGIDKRTK